MQKTKENLMTTICAEGEESYYAGMQHLETRFDDLEKLQGALTPFQAEMKKRIGVGVTGLLCLIDVLHGKTEAEMMESIET